MAGIERFGPPPPSLGFGAQGITEKSPEQSRPDRSRRGALGIGVADRVLILENAYYSVISPEGCAAILWKDRSAAAKAAEALKITARDLLELGLAEEIIPEPLGGAHNDLAATALNVRQSLVRHLRELRELPAAERLRLRYAKYRACGQVLEKTPVPPSQSA